MAITTPNATSGNIAAGARTVGIPSGYAAGDLAVLVLFSNVTVGNGFSAIGGASTNGDPIYVYAKNLTAASGMTSASFTLASDSYYSMWLIRTNTANYAMRTDSFFGVTTAGDTNSFFLNGGPSGYSGEFAGFVFGNLWNVDTFSHTDVYGTTIIADSVGDGHIMLGARGRDSDGYSQVNYGGSATDICKIIFGVRAVPKSGNNSLFFGTNF